MKPNHPHLSTTRLENVNLAAGEARFDLDGRPVNLTGDASAPSVAALHAFHQSALADYRTHRPQASSPGLFSRFKSWLGGIFGKSSSPEMSPASDKVDATLVTADALKVDAISRSRSSMATRQDPSSLRSAETSAASTFKSPSASPTPDLSRHSHATAEPNLHAAFADKEGVHLIWQPSAKKEPQSEVEFTCRLDSEVAGKLQDCYGQLAKLGYKVAGLEVLREPEASVRGLKVDAALVTAERSAAGSCRVPNEGRDLDPSSPAEAGSAATRIASTFKASAAPPAHARERPPTMVMSVSAGPAKETAKGNVLIAPDPLLLRALRAGADPAQPAEERLTFLRGTLGKNGLKITDVGLGEGKEHAPARWENATKWLEHQAEKNANLEIKTPEPSP